MRKKNARWSRFGSDDKALCFVLIQDSALFSNKISVNGSKLWFAA